MTGFDRIQFNCIVASFMVHLVLLILLPGMSDVLPTSMSQPIEVDLIPFTEEILLGTTAIQPDSPKRQAEKDKDRSVQPEKQKSSTTFSAPPLTLPRRDPSADEQPELSTQSLPGIEFPKQAGVLIAPEIKPLEPGKIPDLQSSIPEKPPEYAWLPENSATGEPRSDASSETFAIEGPVARRRVTYQPPPPEIETTAAVTLRLKFWVHPDGTVGRIVPMVRADADIEKAAISFLEKWRFEPVPKDSGDQWGILPIQLKLQ